MAQIFSEFIEEVEGNERKGYVPKDDGGPRESGVTIGTGLDLGQHDLNYIKRLCLPRDIEEKFLFYLGRTGREAKVYLHHNPLVLTEDQVRIVNSALLKVTAEDLERQYNKVSGGVLFSSLPPQIQTAIYSVHLQYGNLPVRTPKFWAAAITQRWEALHHELLHFGDQFYPRRAKEASLVKTVLWK